MAKRVSQKAELERAARREAELLEKLNEAEEAKAAAEDRAEELVDMLDAKDAEAKGLEVEPAPRTNEDLAEPAMIRDPFESQNPHTFLSHPPGYKLGWKNPKYRDGHRGWRSWLPVQYTDEIGQNLDRYLVDPPRRFEHADDNTVRRGDSVLCMIDARYWARRQQVRIEKANRFQADHAADMQTDNYKKKNPVHLNSLGGSSMMSS